MGKTVIKVLGAVISGLNVAVPLILDAQTIFPHWNWQYHARWRKSLSVSLYERERLGFPPLKRGIKGDFGRGVMTF